MRDFRTQPRVRIAGIWRTSLLFSILPFAVGGCGGPETSYGPSAGRVGRVSLNGFGALRRAYENAGFRATDIRRLGDRAAGHDVIVWTPETSGTIAEPVGRWFESWLAAGPRTLVYVLPDSGSEAEYWIAATELAPPKQRLEYRRRSARSMNERLAWRIRRGEAYDEGWFRVEPLERRIPLDEPSGPGDAAVEFRISAIGPAEESPRPPSPVTKAGRGMSTGPSSTNFFFARDTWKSSAEPRLETLAGAVSGVPAVARVTSDRWPRSQILVVAGGSLVTNFAFSRPANRELAGRLIAASTPDQLGANPSATATEKGQDVSAGFLTSGWDGVRVREARPEVPQATGMELLTTWPLSLVTIHAAILGLIACLMLAPVFGRPRRVVAKPSGSFAEHLDAVAALMYQTGGEAYARRRVSDYMKRVRGEIAGPWVLAEPSTPEGSRRPTADPPHRPAASPPQPARSSDKPEPELSQEASR